MNGADLREVFTHQHFSLKQFKGELKFDILPVIHGVKSQRFSYIFYFMMHR